ncbi:RAD51-associated protein 1-like [Lutra lutra]|uniref:RAD51-associated protein 1-like n=1 Tax=Lutra lutra TaxID=9657 RepID=UPI001FD1077A|nr:RAD51-associated protein 1-like [Lutra lutra]
MAMVLATLNQPAGGESEDESDFRESEDDDANFTLGENKVEEIKKKEVKVKSPVEKKEKKPKSKRDTLEVTSRDCAPAALKSESQPSPKKALSVKRPLGNHDKYASLQLEAENLS